ncbi:NrdH-like glutaredoxin [Mycobacterium phage AlleyCat]|uniref:NrdH-like glutaredoxin n=2 Tax=Kratiovirus larva TaxID=1056831 RepID=A0A221J787_9CAUD|nr:NrdH-like glutaredoxin [Mycobacterium phage AlleyCat]QQV92663.1 glutaredoxin [Mycobacterium phage Psycho]WAB09743.1 NrdH-like glutaredoxin [Mycobacterium phage Dadosky]
MITIYTTGPKCYKCNLTKGALDKVGVPYFEVRLDENPELAAEFRAAGKGMAPIVEDALTGDEWFDFRPDRIRAAIVARGINP